MVRLLNISMTLDVEVVDCTFQLMAFKGYLDKGAISYSTIVMLELATTVVTLALKEIKARSILRLKMVVVVVTSNGWLRYSCTLLIERVVNSLESDVRLSSIES